MKNIQLLLAFAAIFISHSEKIFSQEKFQHEKLITIWETKKDLKTPESVLYDSNNDVLYVSNINNKPWEKDNNGYISKMNLKGDITDPQWIKGLSAPKGMGVSKGNLYVADINQIVEIDIKKGEIINKYTVDSAKKLNDITVDKSGTVYISDKGAATVYSLKKGKVELFLRSAELKEINGLFAQGNILYAGLETKVVAIDLTTKLITTFVDNTGPIDGLVPTGKGTFLVSDWTGCIYEIKQGQKPVLLLNTTPLQIYAADIEYIIKENILLVPTFFKDNVVAYKKVL